MSSRKYNARLVLSQTRSSTGYFRIPWYEDAASFHQNLHTQLCRHLYQAYSISPSNDRTPELFSKFQSTNSKSLRSLKTSKKPHRWNHEMFDEVVRLSHDWPLKLGARTSFNPSKLRPCRSSVRLRSNATSKRG